MTRSVMRSGFATVPQANIPRSSFNRSSGLKTTGDCDDLIPIYVDEILPNDTFNMNATALIRLNSPTLHPLMDNLKATIHWFFTPSRLVWPNFEKMHGAQDDPGDSIAYTIPTVHSNTAANLTLANTFSDLCSYFGLPYVASMDLTRVSALPFRCYNKIWNTWYRDENLQDSINESPDDGPDAGSTDYGVLKRGKRYDYFTSALPSLQKGTSVAIPVGSKAYVHAKSDVASNISIYSDDAAAQSYLDADVTLVNVTAGGGASQANTGLYANLADAGPTLNDFRLAVATQQLLERDARAGTRYREHLLAHFGADNDDLRLQRPEYLGGADIPIRINSIANTSEDAAQKQGELTGYGVGTGSAGFTKTFKEWGYLMGLISISGDITYSQGLDRMWSKSTRYDFAYPILANIGEQAVLDQEIFYTSGDSGTNLDSVWGYQPRYEEYRFKNSRLTGLMHVDHASTLASWHLSEDFASLPSLDSTFIESNVTTPLDRAIALPSEPQFNMDFFFDLKCARPLPVNGVPGLTRL